MGSERLEAFSDGVLAIIITIIPDRRIERTLAGVAPGVTGIPTAR